jgi:Recombinase zinc beta ribbon domain/Recombinase
MSSFPYGKSSVREILRNTVYRGMVRCSGQEYQGLHEPLIDEETWHAVQRIREPRAGKGGRVSIRPKNEYAGMLTEIISCAECGHPMVYQPGDGSQRTRNYYYCSRRINWRDCAARMVWTAAVDTQMLQILQALALPDDWKPEILAQAEALLKADMPNNALSREALIAEIERWGEAYARGAIGKAKFERTIADLQARIAEAPHAPRQPTMAELADLLTQFSQIIEHATLVERRAIMRKLFSTIWIQRHEVVAIKPTLLYMPLVVAAQKRYSRASNNQIDGGDLGQRGRNPSQALEGSGKRSAGSRPAHQHAPRNHSSG